MTVALQAASPLAIAGTAGSLALFLSITAHVAARNVLGDVEVRRAFAVGPLPAAVAVVVAALEWPPFLGVALALVADGVLVHYVYRQERRLTLYITFIHAVVSIILGTVLVSLYLLLASAPA